MTTTSPFNDGQFQIDEAGPGAPGGIKLSIRHFDAHPLRIVVRRVDFLDEVASKLGVIVIDKADLPKVLIDSTGMLQAPTARGYESNRPDVNTENLRKRAYALLAIAEYADAHPPVTEVPVDPLVPMLAEQYGIDPENITNAETHRVGNRIIARWTERMVTNGNVTWATRASASVGRFEFGGDTGLSVSEALKAATEEAESIARQMITPAEVKA